MNTNDVFSTSPIGDQSEIVTAKADTGGTSNKNVKRPKGKKFKIAAACVMSLGLLGLGGGIVYFVMNLEQSTPAQLVARAACNRIQSARAKGEGVSPLTANSCAKLNCKFDTSMCSQVCGFGFTMDEDFICPIDCKCAARGVYSGDIGFEVEDIPNLVSIYLNDETDPDFAVYVGSVKRLYAFKTQDGEVSIAYIFHQNLDPDIMEKINEAILWLRENTCINLHYQTPSDRYTLRFEMARTCRTVTGRDYRITRTTYHSVYVREECSSVSALLHLLFHAVGFYHEHSRPDRDEFIQINEDVVQRDADSILYRRFAQHTEEDVANLGFGYNVKSIMHVTSDEYAPEGKYTFVQRSNGQPQLEKAMYPREDDVAELLAFYKCKLPKELVARDGTWSDWGPWGRCSVSCGTGKHRRFHYCRDANGNFALDCQGAPDDVQPCAKEECEQKYGPWGKWGACSASCGPYGTRVRSRECAPGHTCNRKKYFKEYGEYKQCNRIKCEEAEAIEKTYTWQEWRSWTKCDLKLTCEKNNQLRQRFRYCYNNFLIKSAECEKPTYTEEEMKTIYVTYYGDGTMGERTRCVCPDESGHTGRSTEVFSHTVLPTPDTLGPEYVTTTVLFDSLPTFAATLPYEPERELFERHIYLNEFLACPFDEENFIYPTYVIGKFSDSPGVDYFCIFPATGKYGLAQANQGIMSEVQDTGYFSYCKLPYAADFNGDGFDDILCKDPDNRELSVYLYDNGAFQKRPVVLRDFCVDANQNIHIADVDGNGRADVVCEDNNYITIRLNVKESW